MQLTFFFNHIVFFNTDHIFTFSLITLIFLYYLYVTFMKSALLIYQGCNVYCIFSFKSNCNSKYLTLLVPLSSKINVEVLSLHDVSHVTRP